MGLDIADNTFSISERVGSYSGVHLLRRNYIEMTLNYLKSQTDPSHNPSLTQRKSSESDDREKENNSDDDDEINSVEMSAKRVICILHGWITVSGVNYKNMGGHLTEDMVKWKLAGLMHFVNCSDCEGVWSNGQCLDILEFFNMMIEFRKMKKLNEEETNHMEALRDVYKYAVDHKGFVVRC